VLADQRAQFILLVVPKRVVIVADVEPRLVELLTHDPRFDVHRRALGDDLSDAEILVTRTVNRIDAEVLARAPRLEAVAQGTSGIDNIDSEAARKRGIEIVSLPGINANAVAELVLGWIVMLTRRLPQYDREMRSGVWRRDDCAGRHELRHHRLGIIGFGNVGSRVGRIASALGMRVAAYDPYVEEFGGVSRMPSLEALLQQSDIVTLHVPLTAETRRMVDASALRLLPRGAMILNASRGEVLDLDAALEALASGHLEGLALDVFDDEPPARSWPDDPRLILSPHIAGCTHEAKNEAAVKLYERLAAREQPRTDPGRL
jgi:phosphoglycerate dehydrogenase-like enzyme